jgi:hypothetical protein
LPRYRPVERSLFGWRPRWMLSRGRGLLGGCRR